MVNNKLVEKINIGLELIHDLDNYFNNEIHEIHEIHEDVYENIIDIDFDTGYNCYNKNIFCGVFESFKGKNKTKIKDKELKLELIKTLIVPYIKGKGHSTVYRYKIIGMTPNNLITRRYVKLNGYFGPYTDKINNKTDIIEIMHLTSS